MTDPDCLLSRFLVRLRRSRLMFLLLALCAAPAWAQERVLVAWAPGVTTPPTAALLQELGLSHGLELTWVREVAGGISLLEWRSDTAMDQAEVVERLAQDPRVAAVQPDALRRLQFVPNDSRHAEQWYLHEAAGIGAPAAWTLQRGSAAVVIAVLDTGILPHADINPMRILPGYDFYSDLALDNDGVPGWDPDPTDPGDAVAADECGPGTAQDNSSWHGLAVSGIIMATADNAQGIAGIDHGARLLPVRVFGKCGAWTSDLFDAMRWAAGLPVAGATLNPNPAQVINLSLTYDAPCGVVEQSIIDEVIARGAVVVAAAGNGGGDVSGVSPASCQGVITVAAVNRAGERAYYSGVGAAVDIAAPGGDGLGDILTTHNQGIVTPGNDRYAAFRGTSFSTSQVAAVMALMRAEKPAATVNQLRQALRDGARPFPDSSCTTSLCGAGLLDAEGAILAARALPDPASGGGGGGCVQGQASRPEGLWWLGLAWVLYRVGRRNDPCPQRV